MRYHYGSTQKLRRLQKDTNARAVFGHDPSVIEDLLNLKPYFE